MSNSMVSRAAAALLMLSGALGGGLGPCQGGGSVTGGSSQRWPKLNPGLVAPATVNFSYPLLSNPLQSEFTGKSLAIPVPSDYAGGFVLESEAYRLRSIEIRRAGQAPAGVGQALPHALEAVLVHQQSNGKAWASIAVPFQVSGGSSYDGLFPFVVGADMPTKPGQQRPVILSNAYPVDLNPLLAASPLGTFWTTLPTTCGEDVHARQLMVMQARNIGYETYRLLLLTLDHAPKVPAEPSVDGAWALNVCDPQGICSAVAAVDLSQKVSDAQLQLHQAVSELRERKSLMTSAYDTLVGFNNASDASSNVANNVTGTAALDEAISARQDLLAAAQELEAVTAYDAELKVYSAQAATETWDAKNPYASSTAPAASTSTNAAPAAALSQAGSLGFLAPAWRRRDADLRRISV